MEFKGTKGNWEVYTPDHIGCTNVKFGKEEWDGFIKVWHHHNGSMQAKANALLISKAPKMLEMLNRINEDKLWGSDQDFTELKQLIKEATEL